MDSDIRDHELHYIKRTDVIEGKQLGNCCEMTDRGKHEKGVKLVIWYPDCKTALAEAEIEYAEDPCVSVYVKFRTVDDKGRFSALGIDPSKVFFVIWTTTTWTLPGNLAICLGPAFEYSLLRSG